MGALFCIVLLSCIFSFGIFFILQQCRGETSRPHFRSCEVEGLYDRHTLSLLLILFVVPLFIFSYYLLNSGSEYKALFFQIILPF